MYLCDICHSYHDTTGCNTVTKPEPTKHAADKAIAARDKWWIKQVEQIFYNAQQPPNCWQGPDCGTECPRCVYKDWQTLKQETGQ